MKIAYKNRFENTRKICLLTTFGCFVFITWIIFMFVILKQYKTAINTGKALTNTMIWTMDKSCYTQFKNNMDKTLFLQLRFEK